MNNDQFISEADPDYEEKVKHANPKVQAAIEAAKRNMDVSAEDVAKRLGIKTEIRAKYKIEVIFGPDRSTQGPNLAGIQIWESGKRFHGGGDEMMYWCKDNRQGHDGGCWSPIPGDCFKGNIAICPKCHRAVNADLLTNLRVVKLRTKAMADELARMFRIMNHSADIYLKYHYTDVRVKAMVKAKGQQVASRLKGLHIYPLKNILKETSNGAELENRIYAFLTA